MMPKVKLKAAPGQAGTIHASASGKTYEHDADGFVEVDSCDVAALIGSGGHMIVQSELPAAGNAPASDAPDVKEELVSLHRPSPDEHPQQSEDFGGAMPPHGVEHGADGEPLAPEGAEHQLPPEGDRNDL